MSGFQGPSFDLVTMRRQIAGPCFAIRDEMCPGDLYGELVRVLLRENLRAGCDMYVRVGGGVMRVPDLHNGDERGEMIKITRDKVINDWLHKRGLFYLFFLFLCFSFAYFFGAISVLI